MPEKRSRKGVRTPQSKGSVDDKSPIRHLEKLKPFLETVRKGAGKEEPILTSCIRAAFVKAFEFAQFAHGRLHNDFAFHCIGGLRSICEDLIVLKFISGLPPNDQELVLLGQMVQTVHESVRRQVPFFARFRLGQPILKASYDANALGKVENDFICLWQANGWPKKKDGNWPPTEQLAHKIGPGSVDVIYNYIYRLTSGTVHFSTRALLRTGWGPDENSCEFSTTNMGPYYTAFCRVYGVFLLTIYFEFFGVDLGMTESVARHVKRLRHSLILQDRWPEMITFEEMNAEVPKRDVLDLVFQQMLAREFEDGFVSGAEKMENAENVN